MVRTGIENGSFCHSLGCGSGYGFFASLLKNFHSRVIMWLSIEEFSVGYYRAKFS